MKEMFGLLNPFTRELQDSKEGADDEKEVKIEELLSLAKEWDGEGRDVDAERAKLVAIVEDLDA